MNKTKKETSFFLHKKPEHQQGGRISQTNYSQNKNSMEICSIHSAFFESTLRRTIKDKRLLIKVAFQILRDRTKPKGSICPNCTQWRVNLVQAMENQMKTQFVDTADARRKIEDYAAGYDLRKGSPGDRIKRARRKLKLTADTMGRQFGITHSAIIQYERGQRCPPKRILDWLENIGM